MKLPLNSARRRPRPPPLPALLPDLSSLSRSATIAYYHTLNKQLSLAETSNDFPNEASRHAKVSLLRAQLAQIGLESYQKASRAGEALSGGTDSSRWILASLPAYLPLLLPVESLKLLDVGAIAHRFPEKLTLSTSQTHIKLDVTAIDLNPEDSEAGRRVIRADFFDFASAQLALETCFDIICLSLCINFVGCAKRRGHMLHLATKLLRPNGLVFIVLPIACVQNSRYCDEKVFTRILRAVGLEPVATESSAKLFRCVVRRFATKDSALDRRAWEALSGREIVRGGPGRNNFAVRLDWQNVTGAGGRQVHGKKDARGGEVTDGGRKSACGGKKRTLKQGKVSGGVRKAPLTSNQRKRARRKAMRDRNCADKGKV